MIRRLGLTFAFFAALSAVTVPSFADAGCMYRCGLTNKLTKAECYGVCGDKPPTVKPQ